MYLLTPAPDAYVVDAQKSECNYHPYLRTAH